MSDSAFFAGLPSFEQFSGVLEPQNYHPAPLSWSVVVSDVTGSTAAIRQGRYKDVNAIGVASIVAVRNALPGFELPFVFGGDGATLLIPNSEAERVATALKGAQVLARTAFELELRACMIPLDDLRNAGHELLVARYQPHPNVCFAMFAGTGLSAAEDWAKSKQVDPRYTLSEDVEPVADFTGFQCRWQPISNRRGQIVALLVTAFGDEGQMHKTYRRVLEVILSAVSADDEGRPVSPHTLALAEQWANYSQEAKVRTGQLSGLKHALHRGRAYLETQVGRALLKLGLRIGNFDGAQYLREVTQSTDYRKFDATLRMVLDLSDSQLLEIQGFLRDEHARGSLAYGLHRSGAALMTCLVEDYDGKHIHFVDGADGGYALAALGLKQQLAERRRRQSE